MLEPIERRIVDFLEETESRDFFGAGDADELRLLSNAISKSSPALYDSVAETVIEKAPCNMAVVRSDLRRLARILSVNAGISLLKNGNPDELLPTFHLSPDDKQRILKLTQEMRGVIHQTNIFDDKHKQRLLRAVTIVEREIHRSLGRFDVIRGRFDEVGESLNKLGVNLKPLTDRFTEVMKVVRNSATDVDLLPAPDEVKQLPPPDENEQ